MKIIFNTTLDTGYYLNYNEKNNQYLFDIKITGPIGFLNLLERETGTSGKYFSAAERRIEYHHILQDFLKTHPDALFAESFNNDPLGISSTLLQVRDQLILSGWNSQAPDISAKIDTLRNIDLHKMVSPGQEDRWIQVAQTLKNHSTALQMEAIDVLEDASLMHPFFQNLFKLLTEKGIAVTYHNPQTNGTGTSNVEQLKKLSSNNHEKIKLNVEDNHSFQVLTFKNEVEAARFFAIQNLASHSTVLINEDNRIFENVINSYGQPGAGSTAMDVHSGIIQLFKLAASLFLHPFNINHYMDYLQCPLHPVPRVIRWQTLKHIAECGGIHASIINQVIENYPFDNDMKQAETSFFMVPQSGNKLEINALIKFYNSLGGWAIKTAKIKENEDELVSSQLHHLNDLCRLLVTTLREKTNETIENHELPSLVGDIYEPVNAVPGFSRVGAPTVVASPAQLISCPTQTIWLDFYNHDVIPSWYNFLNAHEIEKLMESKYTIWKPEQQAAAMLRYYLDAVYKTQEKLCLVTVEKSGDEPVSDHPLMALFRAKIVNLEDFIIPVDLFQSTDIPGWKLPETEEKQRMELPQKTAEHRIQNGVLIPQRPVESYSSVERIIHDPFDWLFQYALDIKPGFALDLPDEETTMGNTAHYLIQEVFNAGNNDIEKIKNLLNDKYDAFLDAAVENRGAILLLEENRFFYHRLKEQLKKSLDILLEIMNQNHLTIDGIEMEMKEKLPVLDGQEFQGILDMVLKDQTGNPVIIDLKWTRSMKRYREKLSEGKSVQLALYRELAACAKNKTVEKTGYFLLSDGLLLTTNTFTGDNVFNIKPEADDLLTKEKIQRSLAFRRAQLSAGIIEDAEDLKPKDFSYGSDGYSERISLDLDSNGKKRKNYYSAYQLFKGNYK